MHSTVHGSTLTVSSMGNTKLLPVTWVFSGSWHLIEETEISTNIISQVILFKAVIVQVRYAVKRDCGPHE